MNAWLHIRGNLHRKSRSLFLRIAEPRVIRLMQFGVYLCMIIAGLSLLTEPPESFEDVIGMSEIYIFGGFILLGATLGASSVLPGIWWLERVGLISLLTGMAMYMVIVITLGASVFAFVFGIAFAITFIQRWMEIRKYQLAPRER